MKPRKRDKEKPNVGEKPGIGSQQHHISSNPHHHHVQSGHAISHNSTHHNTTNHNSNTNQQDSQYETIKADHELFLQAFEKPTQIYRYLRARNIVSPIFLHRNLHYMKHRRSISSNKRKDFHLSSILVKVDAKLRKLALKERYKSEFMNIEFSGFFDKQASSDVETVEVEVLLLKICHKKRKDVTSPVKQTKLGKVEVPLNPHNLDSSIQPAANNSEPISISHEQFHHNNGHAVKSYVLVLRVRCPVKRYLSNGLCNGDILDGPDEPPHKRRKNGKMSPFEEDVVLYGSELAIYDKHKRCQMTDGDYELSLQDLGSKISPKKNAANWETIVDGKAIGPFEVFSKCPTLKFSLNWTQHSNSNNNSCNTCANSQNRLVKDPCLENTLTPHEFHNNYNHHYHPNHVIHYDDSGIKRDTVVNKAKDTSQPSTPKKKVRIYYQFYYNNNTRQQTEARDDLHCPWCSLNCMQLYSLLKHLRLSHARFNFMYVLHPKGARIDVTINERYDGSYVGNPQDLHSHIGYAFSRNGPVRRTPVTHVIVYRPKRPDPLLSEFMEPETDNQINRQFIQGHNRLYYHTVTCQPIRPQEIDIDSEDENDPEWLRQKTINMIDEFTDVNEGEKELMKLWNLHIMKNKRRGKENGAYSSNSYIADCQIPTACMTFMEEHGEAIIRKNLTRNFMLHMVNLFDFSLIGPEVVQRTMSVLENLKEELGMY
ncbi:Hypothetical predicted protein [Octopus vulgaris]|uniref:Suppressor of zeste 12-like protein n=2 Tax=Octopus TaxID=6643 RepID=A0A4Y1LT28_OCTVU|nr:polycomb protein suz12-A isoform X1 [Octopus sinensis]AWJ58232.1 suppressor of zeste 12-like protein [Octopus vulgaris]CAI9716567.1 Hypothetical predicted protein [Octopus vulgaris]